MSKWPVFICYRQIDGKAVAERIHQLLHQQPLRIDATAELSRDMPILDVYFDQTAPAVADWTEVHEPFLKRSRAMIVVCSPGAKINEGEGDWVHHEISWWLEHRSTAPILVDPLGQGSLYVPAEIAARWPNAQRIGIIDDELKGLAEPQLEAFRERLRSRLMGGILPSAESFYRQELEQERIRSEELQRAFRMAQDRLVRNYIEKGRRSMEENDASSALLWYTKALSHPLECTVASLLRTSISLLMKQLPTIRQIFRHDQPDIDLAHTFDGSRLLTTEGTLVRVVDINTGEAHTSEIVLGEQLRNATLSPDGRWLATLDEDGRGRVWNWATGDAVSPPFKLDGEQAEHAAFSPDSQVLVTVSMEERRAWNQFGDETRELSVIEFWETETWTRRGRQIRADVPPFRPAFSPDGTVLFTADWPFGWQWRGDTGGGVDLPAVIGRPAWCLFTPDGQKLLTGTTDGRIDLWEVSTGQKLTHDDSIIIIPGINPTAAGVHATFSSNGELLALITEAMRLELVRFYRGTHPSAEHFFMERHPLDMGLKPASHAKDRLRVDGEGAYVMALRSNATGPSELRLWDSHAGVPRTPRILRPSHRLNAAFSPIDDSFIMLTDGVAITLQPTANFPLVLDLEPSHTAMSVRSDATGRRILVLQEKYQGRIVIVDTVSFARLHPPLKGLGQVEAAAISEDGFRLAAFTHRQSGLRQVHIWSLPDLRTITKFSPKGRLEQSDVPELFLLGLNGNRVLLKSGDRVELWSIEDASHAVLLDQRNASHASIQCLGGSTIIRSEDPGGLVQVWCADHNSNVFEEAPKAVFPKLERNWWSGTLINPHAEIMITWTAAELQFRHSHTGELICAAIWHSDNISAVALSGDGRLLFTVDQRGHGRLWDGTSGEQLGNGMWHGGAVWDAEFSADSGRLAVVTRGNKLVVWDLTSDTRPEQELLAWAELLSGRRVTNLDALVPLSRDEIMSTWKYVTGNEP